jgi:hypothetical protein
MAHDVRPRGSPSVSWVDRRPGLPAPRPRRRRKCTDFEPMRAGVKVAAGFPTPPGQVSGLVDPRPGSKRGKPPSASGKYGMFGGLAPHFMYTIRESFNVILDRQTTYLILIFVRTEPSTSGCSKSMTDGERALRRPG